MTATNHTEHYGLSQYAQDATGLSATQLDTQYSDDDNIIE